MRYPAEYAEVARPDLPAPGCKVWLVCGPPAAGKSTYVKTHAASGDYVVDLDTIARQHGFGRSRPNDAVGDLLRIRNAYLAALANEPPERTAWVIIGAPSASLRHWWCKMLGVRKDHLILLVPTREELRRRIIADPDRRHVRQLHFELVDKWLAKERADNAGILKRGCGVDGSPRDPLHPWNRAQAKAI